MTCPGSYKPLVPSVTSSAAYCGHCGKSWASSTSAGTPWHHMEYPVTGQVDDPYLDGVYDAFQYMELHSDQGDVEAYLRRRLAQHIESKYPEFKALVDAEMVGKQPYQRFEIRPRVLRHWAPWLARVAARSQTTVR